MTKYIAFYFPQFHEIEENNKFWGKGFTEWDNLRRWKPFFNGHFIRRPHPDLGYYDILDRDVRRKQGEIAKKYGIDGFCIYHYWFKDRPLMEKPLYLMLADGFPDIDFCFCWANEPWTRRWDGFEQEVLIKQEYGSVDEIIKHFLFLIPFFTHKRYIKIQGKPVFIFYRTEHIGIEKLNQIMGIFDSLAKKYKLPGIHFLSIASGFNEIPDGLTKILFQCGYYGKSRHFQSKKINDSYYACDYSALNGVKMNESNLSSFFPGVFSGFDNSPRCINKRIPAIFLNFSPEHFGRMVRETVNHYKPEFLFINSWNEWGEQAILEPDDIFGYGVLEELKKAKNSI